MARGTDIGAHASIGDGRSTALVASDGGIDWLCWPRFDSPALFARLIDPERGGRWTIGPTEPAIVQRHYLESSNVLVTTFRTTGGRASLTDLMAVADDRERPRAMLPEHLLVRRLRGEVGEVEIEIDFAPRPDFGRTPVELRDAGALGLRLEIGARLLTLASAVPLQRHDDGTATAVVRVRAGEVLDFCLSWDETAPAVLVPMPAVDEIIDRTNAFWRRWASNTVYDGPWRHAVLRSALTVKMLEYAPSGAVIAAPTTSLPERVGGDLNWDYRFCWLRDAAFTTCALFGLGQTEDAAAFCGWLLHATRETLPRVKVLYDVFGREPADERELSELGGYRGSRPVRIGNAAADQVQLDVYGETIDAIAQLAIHDGGLDRATRKLLRELGEFVCGNWRAPDQGIWEQRGAPRHYTHSRVLCWAALDRLLDLHARGILDRIPAERFAAHRACIRTEVETRAYDRRLRSYVDVLDGRRVDASLLLLPWYRFHPWSHPRMRGTYELLRRRLEVGPGLWYRDERSVGKGEGAFGICSFWAVEFLAAGGGTLAEAEAMFETSLRYANDVGLFAEEIDPTDGAALGNFPQAYTHVGLVNAALAIAERTRRERSQARGYGRASSAGMLAAEGR